MDTAQKLYILDLDETAEAEIAMATATNDRRELPRYSVSEAALYLRIPEKTLRSWLFGRSYPAVGGSTRVSRPLIDPADGTGNRLSFYNLVEAHILKSTRQRDEVPMSAIRDALDYASRQPSSHPLITKQFLTEGRFLFEEKLGDLVNSSRGGQLAFNELMLNHLDRIDRDSIGFPSVLYPFIPEKPSSRVVAIKPGVSSGVPTVAGTGISIPILFGRHNAGDSIADLAEDYDINVESIEDAIAYLAAA